MRAVYHIRRKGGKVIFLTDPYKMNYEFDELEKLRPKLIRNEAGEYHVQVVSDSHLVAKAILRNLK